MKCRHCGAEIARFTKHIGHGPSQGTVYHYVAHCENGHRYNVKRDGYVFSRVKDQPWIPSKSFSRFKGERSQKSAAARLF